MTTTAKPAWTEGERLAVLDRYQILDTPPESGFDDIVRLTTTLLKVPIAAVNLVAHDRQWFKSEVGLGVREMPLDNSFCARVFLTPGEMIVPDATLDARFDCNPLVTGAPGLRFYAGEALLSREGIPLGTLCALDVVARPGGLSEEQRFILRTLANQVTTLLELRRAVAEREGALVAQHRAASMSRQIFDSAIDYAIIATDLDGRVTSWNEGARRTLGWTEAEMLGQTADRFFTPEDVAAGVVAGEREAALASGRGDDERWHLRKGGERFWAVGEMTVLKNDVGAAEGFVKVLRDRTERRKAGEALRSSEDRYRSLFNSLDVGFCIIEMIFDAGDRPVDYRFIETNPAFERQTDLRNPAGRTIRELAPGIEEGWFGIYGGIALTGEPARFEFESPSLGRWYDVQAYRSGDPAARRVAVLFNDITARKRGEAALQESEARLRDLNAVLEGDVLERTRERDRLWNFTNDLMGTAGLDGYLRAVNPAWSRTLGWNEAELLGRPFSALIDAVDQAATLDVVRRLGSGETVTGFVDRVHRKDGTERVMMWDAVPDGALFHIIGRDITDLRQVEDQLRQAQKMEAVGQLTGGLAHDFNNLLTGIAGSLELLQTRLAQGRFSEIDRYVAAAQGAAKRAAALTHRLLAFSRRQTLDPRPTNVNRLITDMEELIRRTVGPAIAIEVVGSAGLWTALVDPSQLESALLNLCINARDAMPDGGRITIETANKWLDERTGRERDLAPGQYLSMCVSDTGTGMSPEIVARAFDPFFTTKPIGQGTGLGLSMIYGFARQSGGQVRIYSEIGQGTTMCLYLPRHHGEETPVDDPAETTRAPRAEQGQTVLVVDDEPTVRMLVAEVLEELGYVAIEAMDGAAGLKILRSDVRIDMLVTDVGLPGGMNGRQMADAGRQWRPGLKTLFITGYAENAAVGNGHLDPGMHVLTKPFAMEELASRIRKVLAE